MTAFRQCDGCGKQASEGESMLWFHLARSGLRFVLEPSEWHLCSWECVAAIGGREASNESAVEAKREKAREACQYDDLQAITEKINDAVSRLIDKGWPSPPLPVAK
jgi:hypothetical protein